MLLKAKLNVVKPKLNKKKLQLRLQIMQQLNLQLQANE